MIQTFLRNTRSLGEVVNTAVAMAVANAFVERHTEQELDPVQVRAFTWARCTNSDLYWGQKYVVPSHEFC